MKSIHRPSQASNNLMKSINYFLLSTALFCLLSQPTLLLAQGPQLQDQSVFTTTTNPTEIITIDINNYKKPSWTAQEITNTEAVIDFVQHIMNNHDLDYISNQYGNSPYKQHNRNIADGIPGLVETMGKTIKRYPEFTYDVQHIYVDGPFVTLHSHATIKVKDRGNPNKGFNIIDTWKVENGKLVEHWDAVQGINGSMRFFTWMTGGKVRNENGLF